jgi:hypothetical protein
MRWFEGKTSKGPFRTHGCVQEIGQDLIHVYISKKDF